jgi:hypothetical protein
MNSISNPTPSMVNGTTKSTRAETQRNPVGY